MALMGINNVAPLENVYLPASFLGSVQWALEQIVDSLAATFPWDLQLFSSLSPATQSRQKSNLNYYLARLHSIIHWLFAEFSNESLHI